MLVEIGVISVEYGAAEYAAQTNEQRVRRLHRLGYITPAQQLFLLRQVHSTQITDSYQNHRLDVHIYLNNPEPKIATLGRLLFQCTT